MDSLDGHHLPAALSRNREEELSPKLRHRHHPNAIVSRVFREIVTNYWPGEDVILSAAKNPRSFPWSNNVSGMIERH
jgi:hypothetical protein